MYWVQAYSIFISFNKNYYSKKELKKETSIYSINQIFQDGKRYCYVGGFLFELEYL